MGDTAATDSYRVLLSGGEGEIVEKNPVSSQRSVSVKLRKRP